MPFWFVMVLLAEGLVVGALAPSVSGSVLLGLVGSYLGGVIAWLFINAGVGVVFAAIGAVALVYTRRRFLEAR